MKSEGYNSDLGSDASGSCESEALGCGSNTLSSLGIVQINATPLGHPGMMVIVAEWVPGFIMSHTRAMISQMGATRPDLSRHIRMVDISFGNSHEVDDICSGRDVSDLILPGFFFRGRAGVYEYVGSVNKQSLCDALTHVLEAA